MSKPVYLTVSNAGGNNLQLSIDDEDGGYRLHGPKFNGSSRPLIQHRLTARDCDELEQYIAQARAVLKEPRS